MMTHVTQDALNFLQALKTNNNRDWFQEHKASFKAIETDIKTLYQGIFDRLNQHDTVDKHKVFRIYRDVRFSKDKTPYKTHFGGSFHRQKPELRGGYFLHIAPDNDSFLAVGFWEPVSADLLRIRKELEIDADEFRSVIQHPEFKSVWGELKGDSLKSAPRGFSKDHPDLDLIKHKSFIFTKAFTDQDVMQSDFIEAVDHAFRKVRPFFDYMSAVLTTDLNRESLI